MIKAENNSQSAIRNPQSSASGDRDPAPGRDGLPTCRECLLPARLRDGHFLQLARREGVASLKSHIIRELGQDKFNAMGGDYHGVMDWIRGMLRFEEWEKESAKSP